MDPQFDGEIDTPALAFETEEPELSLGDFEDKLGMHSGPEIEDLPEDLSVNLTWI